MNEEKEIGYVYKETLENIASAIKEKLQSPSSMYPSEMDDRIRMIDTSGIHPTGTINITENGNYDVTNYASASVNTPGAEAYFDGTIGNGTSASSGINTHIVSIPANTTVSTGSLTYAFYNCKNLTSIPLINTSSVTDMSSMFQNCVHLTTIPQLNTSNVTNMNNMFYGCTDLASISQINTSNVTNMNSMFYQCTSLTTIPQLNTSNVTDFAVMFRGCSSLTSIPQLDTSNGTKLGSLFRDCSSLTSIPTLDLTSATNISSICYGCGNLISTPNFINSTNLLNTADSMFNGCTNLTTANINLNLTTVNNLSYMFNNCVNLTSVDFSNSPNGTGVSDTHSMFYNCKRLTFIDMRIFDFTQITYSTNMFGQFGENLVPANCLIIVADNTQKAWLNSHFSRLTNVKTVAEYEGS